MAKPVFYVVNQASAVLMPLEVPWPPRPKVIAGVGLDLPTLHARGYDQATKRVAGTDLPVIRRRGLDA